ncbi:MAG: GNAT family N-acetyltransferase [Fibrobacteres bacterium]|nr:GNAT family N-acetyltransferase [Fibrobacterota bacterium]
MNDITLRSEVKPEDCRIVREIIESTGYFGSHEVDVAVELVEENLKKGEVKSGYYFLFAEENGKTIGYTCYGEIACTIGSFDLYWIAVSNDVRSKGLGSLLLIETEKKIREMKGRAIYIETSNKELYQSTRGFYLKNGYSEAAVLDHFYAENDGKVIYRKFI